MSFAIWLNLLNNFAIEKVGFDGSEMGILQSLREIPGFLAFTIIFVLLFIKEQKMAFVSTVNVQVILPETVHVNERIVLHLKDLL